MPTQWSTFPIKFEGGWRTDLGRLEHGIQAPGSATTLQNFEPAIDGGYSKILGYSKYSETEVTGSGTIIGVVVVDQTRCLARRDDDYYLSSGTTWTSKGTVTTGGAVKVKHAHYNFNGTKKIILVDGVEDPFIFDTVAETGSFDTAAPADVTGANLVEVFKNHVFFAKGNLLNFTAPYTDNDYNTANGAGVINVGSDISGLIVFREQLIIFSHDRIQRLSGNTAEDFVLQPIANNTGCLCAFSIAEVGGDIMYLGPDGIRWLSATERNNDFGLERASKEIQSELIRLVNTNCGYTALTVRSKSQYRLFTYLSGTPREATEGFLATKFSDQSVSNISWAHLVGIKVYTGDSQQFRDQEVILFSSETGYVYRMESGNSFDGIDIEAIFETPYMPITDPRLRKTLYKHSLYCVLGGNFDLDVSVRFDYNNSGIIQPPSWTHSTTGATESVYGSPTAIYGTSTYSTLLEDIFVNQTVGSGFTIALRYEDTSSNPPFSLDYAVLEYRENERR